MRTTGLRDKMDTPQAAPEACPHCGREMSPHGCRQVLRGFWCLAGGLIADPASVISSVPPDLVRPLVDADPEVLAANAELETVQALFAKRDQEWRDICLALINARNTFSSQMRIDYANQQMVYPKGSGLADQDRLERQQMQAAEIRDEAHQLVIRARGRLEAVQRRSRARLTQPAA